MADNGIIHVYKDRKQFKSFSGFPFCSLMDLPGCTAETVWSLLLYLERITTTKVLNLRKTRGYWRILNPRALLTVNKVRWWLNLAIHSFFFFCREPISSISCKLKSKWSFQRVTDFFFPVFFFVIWKFNPALWVLFAASIVWLPQQLRWRRPWKCRHCRET